MAAVPEIEFCAVAAIDFGTARSGYGYAFSASPNEINCPTDWAGGRGIDLKTLTNILLNRGSEKYMHFGYKAREHYFDADDEEEGKRKDLFFETFKMSLYSDDGVQEYLTSSCGTRVKSHVVFREALAFMKDQVLSKINESDARDTEVLSRDIMWVITVPGMWRDQAKTIMRNAAEGAGMGTHHNLILALEPEAASIQVRSEYKEMEQLPEGSKYIVVDCGGGTADFACHEISRNGVNETHPAVGGPWGSTYIDKRFIELLCDILGEEMITEFKFGKPSGWLQLLDGWEGAKLRMKDFKTPRRIPLPYSLVEMLGGEKEIRTRCKVYSNSDKAKNSGINVKFSEGLKLNGDAIKYLFSPMLEGISGQIKTLLDAGQVRGSTHLFVVGGFAESIILQDHLKSNFPDMTPVIPNRPGLSVIQGAVRFGLNPSVVESRKARFTYGMKIAQVFEDGDPVTLRFVGSDGVPRCDGHFLVFVKKGQDVGYDEIVNKAAYPLSMYQKSVLRKFYASDSDDPKFVTDGGCDEIGSIEIPLPVGHGCKAVECDMKFGGTEIQATSITHDGQKHEIWLDFLTQ